MNDEDIKLVKQIAKDTVSEVLDMEVWDVIFELVNALEAGATSFKRKLGIKKDLVQNRQWNPDKIKWAPAEGQSGAYERSEDVNNPEFKTMLKDLAAHKGRLTRDGWFYWRFKNGSTVGRKKRG